MSYNTYTNGATSFTISSGSFTSNTSNYIYTVPISYIYAPYVPCSCYPVVNIPYFPGTPEGKIPFNGIFYEKTDPALPSHVLNAYLESA